MPKSQSSKVRPAAKASTWTTRRQIAANQLIPLSEPARRGLIILTNDVIATGNQSSPWPLNST
jgi:hypothetical protein